MKYTIEINDRIDCNYLLWGQALENIKHLTDDQLETILENFGDGQASITDLNDFLSFETDEIAEWFDFESWEDLLKHEEDEDND